MGDFDYQIQAGDTLDKIAKLYGITVEQIKKANGIKNSQLIFEGKNIKLPDITDDNAFNDIPGITLSKKGDQQHQDLEKFSENRSPVRSVYMAPINPEWPKQPSAPLKPTPTMPILGNDKPKPIQMPNPEPIISKPTEPQPIEPPKPETTLPLKKVKIKATAKDFALLEKYNVSKIKNNPNAQAQFVSGEDDNEVEITGAIDKPTTITIHDDTNGQVNTFVYRLLTKEEIDSGQTLDGQKINKEQFDGDGPYYILVSAQDPNGKSLKLNHVEIYKLKLDVDKENFTISYELEQYEGMDGSNKSSIDYNQRNSISKKKQHE